MREKPLPKPAMPPTGRPNAPLRKALLRPRNNRAALWLAAACLVFLLPPSVCAENTPLVEVRQVIPTILSELRYATSDNFMGERLYPEKAVCYLRPEVAAKLSRVQARLAEKGLGLKIFDGYRPLSVQKRMWRRFPQEGYVANPAKGSNHNRGAAVDVTLVDAAGNELPMPTPYDEFSERAHRGYEGAAPAEMKNRRLLEESMEAEGFKGLSTEWWHFDDADAASYPVLDLPL